MLVLLASTWHPAALIDATNLPSIDLSREITRERAAAIPITSVESALEIKIVTSITGSPNERVETIASNANFMEGFGKYKHVSSVHR
jgi:hypothetical protein